MRMLLRVSELVNRGSVAVLLLMVGCTSDPVRDLAIRDVTIIDPAAGTTRPHQTVLVQGGRIVTVVAASSSPTFRAEKVIIATGQFLIPGLWDMHVHALWDATVAQVFLPLFVANGVTGVRDMGGPLDAVLTWRAAVRSGAVTGPRVVAAGPILDGPEPVDPSISWAISTAADGRRAVDSLARAGVDLIKVYTPLPPDAFEAIAERAAELDLPVAGHVPGTVSPSRAARLGMRSMEHLRTELDGLCDPDIRTDCLPLFAELRAHQVWQTPTLFVRHVAAMGYDDRVVDESRLRYLPDIVSQFWNAAREQAAHRSPEVDARLARHVHRQRQLIAALRDAGVPILAGTDAGDRFCFPGFTLHDELALLVDAGLSAEEALAAATVNAAEYLGAADSLGRIEPNGVADLVLLDGNPLEHISNTRRVAAVVLRGVLYDRDALDRLLEEVAAAAQAEGATTPTVPGAQPR